MKRNLILALGLTVVLPMALNGCSSAANEAKTPSALETIEASSSETAAQDEAAIETSADETDLSGSGEAYMFSNFVMRALVTTDAQGVITKLEIDQAYPAFSWARVALTEEEKVNVPEDVLVGGISLTSPTQEEMAFSKYICIDGHIFEGSLRQEGDPWLSFNSEQTVKYSSMDGEIEDLVEWMSASEENMKKYYEDCAARNMYICLEDGSPNPRPTGTECLVKEGLPHAGEVAFLRSESDLSAEKPYFDWDKNYEAIYDSMFGTTMSSRVSDLTQVEGEDGKQYWQTLDGVTGATLVTYGSFYETVKTAYDRIMDEK